MCDATWTFSLMGSNTKHQQQQPPPNGQPPAAPARRRRSGEGMASVRQHLREHLEREQQERRPDEDDGAPR